MRFRVHRFLPNKSCTCSWGSETLSRTLRTLFTALLLEMLKRVQLKNETLNRKIIALDCLRIKLKATYSNAFRRFKYDFSDVIPAMSTPTVLKKEALSMSWDLRRAKKLIVFAKNVKLTNGKKSLLEVGFFEWFNKLIYQGNLKYLQRLGGLPKSQLVWATYHITTSKDFRVWCLNSCFSAATTRPEPSRLIYQTSLLGLDGNQTLVKLQ